ncbi:response regulator transcription factor [Propioniciclava sinopodophylli]|nr:hypothetical protein [Propioniciclava sinopodophylli]
MVNAPDLRLLVVDDDAAVREALVRFFASRAGVEVVGEARATRAPASSR